MTGYFGGFDVSGGNINVETIESTRKYVGRPGGKTLLSLQKLSVDRLGHVSLVRSEVRTWHGEACT